MPVAPGFNELDVPYGALPQDEVPNSRLEYYLAYRELEQLRTRPLVRSLLNKPFKWESNQAANKLRVEQYSPSPILRQIPNPNKLLTEEPNIDIIGLRRWVIEAEPWSHGFRSTEFSWQNSFVDAFPTTIEQTRKDMQDKVLLFDEQKLLGDLWYNCPNIYVAGRGWVTSSIPGSAVDPNTVKTADWVVSQMIPGVKEASVTDFIKICSELLDNQSILPFEGSPTGEKQMVPMGKLAMLASTEFALNTTFDSWVKEQKSQLVDIVGSAWKDTPFGLYSWRTWRHPFRFMENGSQTAPETFATGTTAFNANETIPSPLYTSIGQSPYELILILGKDAGAPMEIGPPPSEFTGQSVKDTILTMDWNGKIRLNRNILVKSVDQAGTADWQINPFGKKARLEALVAGGFVPAQRRAIAAYFFKRKLGN